MNQDTKLIQLTAINEAIQAVFNAMLNLSDEARKRVLKSVAIQYGLSTEIGP